MDQPNKSPFGSLQNVNIEKLAAQVTLTSADNDIFSTIKQTGMSKSNKINKHSKAGI